MLEIISPWCLGQQFMTRLCANACFKKLFSSLSCPKIRNKYQIINKCIDETIDQGDRSKNEQKISSDFYLHDFHPDDNLNLSDIFNHFPRLLKVNDIIRDDVWNNEILLKIPRFNEKSLLRTCKVSSEDKEDSGMDSLYEEVSESF